MDSRITIIKITIDSMNIQPWIVVDVHGYMILTHTELTIDSIENGHGGPSPFHGIPENLPIKMFTKNENP